VRNDVLDLARIEAGKMTFLPEPVELEELVGEKYLLRHPAAHFHGAAGAIAPFFSKIDFLWLP
jgi:signal transduction histidine kinase